MNGSARGAKAVMELPPGLGARIDARVASGALPDLADVIRDGLTALGSEDAGRLGAIRQKVASALADPSPSGSAAAAFDRVTDFLKSLPRK